MEFTDLSLASKQWVDGESSQLSETTMKIKWDREVQQQQQQQQQQKQNNIIVDDLQLQNHLPNSDWEQFLDLQSGRMYYVNRKTSMKIWDKPNQEHNKIDLELNISTGGGGGSGNINDENYMSNMVALACSNCHLLVILSKSSPSCPNCKYVHSLAFSPKYL